MSTKISVVKRILASIVSLGPVKTPTLAPAGAATRGCQFTLEHGGERPDLAKELDRIAGLKEADQRKAYVILANALIDMTLDELIAITTAMRESAGPGTINRVVHIYYSEHREDLVARDAAAVARAAGTPGEKDRLLMDFTRLRVESLAPVEVIELAQVAETEVQRDAILSIYNSREDHFIPVNDAIAMSRAAHDLDVRDEILLSYARRNFARLRPVDAVRLARATIRGHSHNAIILFLIQKIDPIAVDDAIAMAGATRSAEAQDEVLEAYLNFCFLEHKPLTADQACALATKAITSSMKDKILVRFASVRKSSLTSAHLRALAYHATSPEAKAEIEALD